MSYTKETIKKKVDTRDKPLYQTGCVNYGGRTTDTKEKYTEVIASHLLTDLRVFRDGIAQVKHDRSYRVEGHKWHPYDPADDTVSRKEEHIARSLYDRKRGELHFIDYQIPLKNARDDANKGLGKIDLLAWDGKSLVILELKRPGSAETLLRCVLEAYTYWKTVDQAKLAADFDRPGAPVRAAALVFAGSRPHNDWNDKQQPYVKKLMERLGIGLYVMDNDIINQVENGFA
jgi:hypothetical protein